MGALLSMTLPLTGAFLLWLILVRLHLRIEFSHEVWARLGMCWIISLIYVSCFILLGLWISSGVNRSATALTMLILLWVIVGVIYPNFAAWTITQTHPIRAPGSMSGTSHGDHHRSTEEAEVVNRAIAQAHVAAVWTALSPWEAYRTAVAILARTDLGSYLRFRRMGEHLQQQLEAWHREKIARFPNRERNWSSSDPDLELSGLPQAPWSPEPVSESLSRLLPYAGYLLGLNGLLFLGAAWALTRYDPRHEL
jgi:hypothetical protein